MEQHCLHGAREPGRHRPVRERIRVRASSGDHATVDEQVRARIDPELTPWGGRRLPRQAEQGDDRAKLAAGPAGGIDHPGALRGQCGTEQEETDDSAGTRRW